MELRVTARKSFGAFNLEADFAVSGERIGIFGESGSGKSTLVNLLAGLLQPDAGDVLLNGDCLFSSSRRICSPPEARRIAVVFQYPHLFPHLSVQDNLLYGYKRCRPEFRTIDFAALVAVLRLESLLNRGVNNLSGGEKQRVAIGRAVMSNPRLFLMDEPLSALDEELKYQIITYLKSVCDTFAIPFVFISHSLLEMQLMTDSVIVFENGRAIEQATPEQLARRRMGTTRSGYVNLLRVGTPRLVDGLSAYPWGGGELLVLPAGASPAAVLELSSKDIILCKKNPEAISARNLLRCRITGIINVGARTGVELACGGERLVAEVVRQAAVELDIREGSEVYAVIKASAFRELG